MVAAAAIQWAASSPSMQPHLTLTKSLLNTTYMSAIFLFVGWNFFYPTWTVYIGVAEIKDTLMCTCQLNMRFFSNRTPGTKKLNVNNSFLILRDYKCEHYRCAVFRSIKYMVVNQKSQFQSHVIWHCQAQRNAAGFLVGCGSALHR